MWQADPAAARQGRNGGDPSRSVRIARQAFVGRVALLYEQGPSTILASFIALLVVAVAVNGHLPRRWLAIWGLAHVVTASLRWLLVRAYWHARPQGFEANRFWMRVYAVGALASGLLWGGALFFLGADWPAEVIVLVYTVGTGLLVGSVPTNALVYPVYLAFMLPILAGLALWPLVAGAVRFVPVGMLMLALGGVILLLARDYNRAMRRMFRLQAENEVLVGELLEHNRERLRHLRRLQRAERELQRERQLFLEGPVVVFRCRASEGWPIEYISPNVLQFGMNFETLAFEKAPFLRLVHQEDARRLEAASRGGAGHYDFAHLDAEIRLKLPGGGTRWVYCYIVPVFDAQGRVEHFDGYLLDISKLKAAQLALQREKERAQVTLQSIGDAVITTNVHGRIEIMNPMAERLTGWRLADAQGKALSLVYQVSDEETGVRVASPVAKCLRSDRGGIDTRMMLLHRRDGRDVPIRQTVAAIRSATGEPLGATIVFHDMSEARALAQQLAYHATHDPLTDLINRREFERRLKHALRSAKEELKQHVVLYMDLDQFKVVNDTCGHVAGDELLKQLATMLRKQLRGSDTIARLGGDEFGVLLQGCSLQEGRAIADTLRHTVSQFRFVWEEKTFEVGASVGVVAITPDSMDVVSVLSQADMACYAAKDRGRNRVHIYEESDEELARRRGEMRWVSQISRALKEDRFALYYQEIRPLRHAPDEDRHIEVLIRLLDEHGEQVSPGVILPAAERYNLVGGIDRWVVEHVLEWYAHNATGHRLHVAINLSGATLGDHTFLEFVQERMRVWRVPPWMICFEITENAAIANLGEATEFMQRLKQLGCQFALDDFGSGLSSFAYLKSLPVDYLKIDGRFVRGMLDDPVDCTMVSAINEVGQAMGLRTIAEYAENEAIIRELDRLAVDYVQGYGVAPPRPLRLFSF
ncbi:MAG TPA: EAL domain-containing protein [Chromatiales bacterium]|nr:EAL domain-containing protein [Chromatiales bacterium]